MRPSQTSLPQGMPWAAASIRSKSMSTRPSSTVYIPHPMSTPTMLGTALSVMVMVVPMVQPRPAWTSGMIRIRDPAVKSWSHILRICSMASSSTTAA